MPPNKLIDDVVPEINSMEEALERDQRTRLAQLRTNKSPFPKSYLNKIDSKSYPSPLCPLCKIENHDTHHLFKCIKIPTKLNILDSWNDPCGSTELLDTWVQLGNYQNVTGGGG